MGFFFCSALGAAGRFSPMTSYLTPFFSMRIALVKALGSFASIRTLSEPLLLFLPLLFAGLDFFVGFFFAVLLLLSWTALFSSFFAPVVAAASAGVAMHASESTMGARMLPRATFRKNCTVNSCGLPEECEEHRGDNQHEGDDVVPLERFVVEYRGRDDREYGDGDGFLDDLELHKAERPAIDTAADGVCRDHEEVLDEGNAPRCENHEDERPVGADVHFLQLEVAVPGGGHEHVADDEEDDGKNSGFHMFSRKLEVGSRKWFRYEVGRRGLPLSHEQ